MALAQIGPQNGPELQLTMTWSTENVAPGTDADPANPLARSLRQLFEEGNPFQRLVPVLLATSPYMRWFGVFVLTQANRVCFFHGLDTAKPRVYLADPPDGVSPQFDDFDHITLESDRDRWHLTGSRSLDHRPGAYARVMLNSSATFWFGIALRAETSLRQVHHETTISSRVAESDWARRAEVVQNAREGINFPILDVAPAAAEGTQFVHFGVLIGPSGFTPHDGEVIGVPWEMIPDARVINARYSAPFEIASGLAVQITTARFAGELPKPMVMTGLRRAQ